MSILLRVLGIGALVAGGLAIAVAALVAAVLLGPLIFWLAWNVLNFAAAIGLPELGFWGIVLATLFLVVSWFGKVVMAAIVFLLDLLEAEVELDLEAGRVSVELHVLPGLGRLWLCVDRSELSACRM